MFLCIVQHVLGALEEALHFPGEYLLLFSKYTVNVPAAEIRHERRVKVVVC